MGELSHAHLYTGSTAAAESALASARVERSAAGGITTLVAAEWAKLSDEEKAAYKPATGEGTIPLSSYNYLRKSAQVTLDREKDLVRQALAMAQVLVSADGNTDTDTLVDPETVASAQASLIDMGVVKRCLKAKKDPNAPKGIRSAYMLWCEANRTAVQEQHPTFKMTDIAKALGNLWKTVEDEVKAEFQEKSAADKERYAQEKEAYEQQLALATGGLTGAGATNAEAESERASMVCVCQPWSHFIHEVAVELRPRAGGVSVNERVPVEPSARRRAASRTASEA